MMAITGIAGSVLPRRTRPVGVDEPVVLPRPGDVVRVAAHDYLGGSIPITARVAAIDTSLNALQVSGLEWVSMIVSDTSSPDGDLRCLVVRVSGLYTIPAIPDPMAGRAVLRTCPTRTTADQPDRLRTWSHQ